MTTFRFIVALLFAPILALNADAFFDALANGQFLEQSFTSVSFFTGSAGGMGALSLLFLFAYLALSLLIYLPLSKSKCSFNQYLLYGSVPVLGIGALGLLINVHLNFIQYLYASLLLSSSFWFISTFKYKSIDSNKFVFYSQTAFSVLLCVLLILMVNLKFEGLTLVGEVKEITKRTSSICQSPEQLQSKTCLARPLIMGVSNPFVPSTVFNDYQGRLGCKKGDKILLVDMRPFVQKIQGLEISKIPFSRVKCFR